MKTNAILTSLTLAALMGATISTAALSEGRGPRAAINFEAMDADNDGKLTEVEMEAYRVARLTALDVDNDGKVTLEELAAIGMENAKKRAERRAEQMMERHDADKDGVLTVAELTARPERRSMFSRIDTDGDGAITKTEAEAAQDRMAERHGKRKN
jgi:Ca2+-binding EF-hand superfamily protein